MRISTDLGLPLPIAMVGGLLERNTRRGTIIVVPQQTAEKSLAVTL